METQEASNQLLENKYGLHKSREVKSAAIRRQMRTGKKVPQDPLLRIQNYLNRFHEIIERGGPTRKEHNLDLIKTRIHQKYVIKPNEIPESFWENQKRIIRERGQGADLEQVDFEELKRQNTEAIIADQRSSLDKWIDYLSSPDAPYTDGLKYFTLRSVLNMAEYDKEKKIYPQRSKGTTKPFPDLNREALAYVLDAIDKKYKGQNIDISSLESQDAKEFENLLKGENFSRLYAWAIEKITPASPEELSATRGEWIKYNQGADHKPLVQSLQGHGTGWCTAGESTAKVQLQGGDFYVYYSLDREGKPTVPRAAIRMEGARIAEVRGIAAEQNLDGGVVPIVEEKLKEFPDGPSYQKRVSDMRRLTSIEHQLEEGQNLTSEDLAFLYEIDMSIEGFGYSRDPRIRELRDKRNPEEDIPVVFGCSKDQIAQRPSQIDSNTRVYVGKLEKGIFDLIKKYNIEHVYTSFPEGKIRIEPLEIGGRDFKASFEELEKKLDIKDELIWSRAREIFEQAKAGLVQISEDTIELLSQLVERQINISSQALYMLKSADFSTLPNPQEQDTIRLRVGDLGLRGTPTTDQVYASAKELELDLCPAEVGPHLLLKDLNQPLGDWYWIAMKQMTDVYGRPRVFGLGRGGDGLWLYGFLGPGDRWGPQDGFVFCLRK